MSGNWSFTNVVDPLYDINVVKDHIRVPRDYTDDDALIEGYFVAALNQVAGDCERVISKCLAVYTGGQWHTDILRGEYAFRLDKLPIRSPEGSESAIKVEYKKADGSWSVLSEGVEMLSAGEPRKVFVKMDGMADFDYCAHERFRITVPVGYEELPKSVFVPACMWVAEYYRFREVVAYAQQTAAWKRAYNAAITALRWRAYP